MQSCDVETSHLIILQGASTEGYSNFWAVFPLPRTTVNERYVAVHFEPKDPNVWSWEFEMLLVFESNLEVLTWCCFLQQEKKALFRGGLKTPFHDAEWLEQQAKSLGFEDWKDFVESNGY